MTTTPSTRFNAKRSDTLTFPISEVPALSLDVQPSLISISGSGSDSKNYDIRLCAEAGAATQDTAAGLLEKIRLTRDGNTVRLASPSVSSPKLRSLVDVRVSAPRDVPINVSGTYAALAVHDMNASVKLMTTHSRVTVLETTGDVDATVKEFGIIDFSGSRGHVRLDAPTEINLNFVGQKFDGSLTAKADWTIRMVLPMKFSSSFEAEVNKKADFACRADICDEVKRSNRSGHVVFSYGGGEPMLRLTSVQGAVALYNTNSLNP